MLFPFISQAFLITLNLNYFFINFLIEIGLSTSIAQKIVFLREANDTTIESKISIATLSALELKGCLVYG